MSLFGKQGLGKQSSGNPGPEVYKEHGSRLAWILAITISVGAAPEHVR